MCDALKLDAECMEYYGGVESNFSGGGSRLPSVVSYCFAFPKLG